MPSPSGSTPIYGFPYLLETDPADFATESEDLALAVEAIIPTAYIAGSMALTANQNVSSLAQLVNFTTEFLEGGVTNPGSGLVVPTAGKYRVSFGAFLSTTGPNNTIEVYLYKNGGQILKATAFTTAASQTLTLSQSKAIVCAANDTFTLFAESPTDFSSFFAGADTFLSLERAAA